MKGFRFAAILAVALSASVGATFASRATAPDQLWPASAQFASRSAPASAVTLIAEAGFNGYVKPGNWIPVRVMLNSNESIDGEIALSPQPDRSRRYAAPVTLARNVRKQLTLYSPPTTNPIEALFIVNGRVIAATAPPIRLLAQEDRMIAVVSDPPDSLNFLSDLRTPYGGKSYVAQMRLDQIPDHTAPLDSVDVLVLNNVDSLALSEAQRSAIRSWLLGGGQLIIGGGPGAKLTVAGFEALAPARIGTTLENSSLISLRDILLPNTVEPVAVITTAVPAPVVVLQPAIDDARSLVNSKDTPLVVRRAIGRGIVDQLAFDPTLAPVRDWPDRRLIFAALFGGRVGYSSVLGPLRADFNAANAARALPSAALPPFLVVAGFLLLYVLTIGPINFFFLRKLNRLSWAWLTIPATVVLFALLGTATGFRLRGNEPQVHRLSIVSGDAYIEDGRAQSIVGLFAPRRTVLDVTTDNNLAEEVQPDPNLQSRLDFLFSSPNRLADVIATNNDVRTFYLRGEAELPHVEADLDLIPGNSAAEVARITGEVHNESLAFLRDCVLVAGRDYHVIGDIGPNAHVPAEIRLLLNRPQMSMVPPATRLSATSYSSSISTGAGRSGLSSAALPSYRSAFDMDGAPLTDALLNWRDFGQDRLVEQAERNLVSAIFDNPDSSIGNGVHLACWESQNRIGVEVAGGSYTDRGLRIWRLPVHPFLARNGAQIPPDVYGWNVVASSSAVDLSQNGLSMDPGEHILAISPWMGVRTTANVGISLTLATGINSSLAALRITTVSIYDWQAQQFTRVITGLNTSSAEVSISGAYTSPSGEIRVRVDVVDDQITLTNIATRVHVP